MKNLLFALFSTLLISAFTPAAAKESSSSINAALINQKTAIGKYSCYLADPSAVLTIEEVSADFFGERSLGWEQSDQEHLGFGFTTTVHWIYFKLNGLHENGEFALELDYPHIDKIDLYILENGKPMEHVSSGDTRPFKNRDLFYRNFTHRLNNRTDSIHCMLKIQSNGAVTLPLYIWKTDALLKRITTETFLLGLYYGLLCIIIIFNVLLYLSIRDINYVYYTLWIIGYGGYQFAINGLGFQFIWTSNSYITEHSVPFLIFFGIIWAYQFGRTFLNTAENFPGIDRVLKLHPPLMAFGALSSLFAPYWIVIRLAVVSVLMLSIIMVSLSFAGLIKGLRAARFYIMAWTFLFLGVTIYALKSAAILPENTFTSWAQMVGSAFEMIILSVALTDRINQINKEKKKAIETRNRELVEHNKEQDRAYRDLMISEERYRILIEGADDIIFTMSENYIILSINNRAKTLLRLNPERLLNRSILDFIYVDEIDNLGVSKEFVKDRIDHLVKTGESVTFKADFISPIKSEPLELKIRLEYNTLSGHNEIIGRASSLQSDSLLKYFISESQFLNMDNYLMAVEDITYRITRNLIKYFLPSEIKLIRTALREILFNAIEHGNLGISFEDKSLAMESGSYFELLSQRRKDPCCKDRKVHIEYSISPDKVTYTVEDEGEGFDHKKMIEEANKQANELMLTHGRGISMTCKIFDKVEYNTKGNSVVLTRFVDSSKLH